MSMKRQAAGVKRSKKVAVAHRRKRHARGRTRANAMFPVAPPRAELPADYVATLAGIKQRVSAQRLRVVTAANTAMVELYWDIGRTILDRQLNAGWGAKIIDRLSQDLGAAYPDMQGFSPRNLKYMRAFAAAWPDRDFVQRTVARLPWRQNLALLERLDEVGTRAWYARRALEQGWSRDILVLQIENRAHARHGRTVSTFARTLPPADSDMAEQIFKDPTCSTSSAPPIPGARARSSRPSSTTSSGSSSSWAPASRSSAAGSTWRLANRTSTSTSSSIT
jgi:predicted nuclease of restriction endonuclease-like (RecB) superfamily